MKMKRRRTNPPTPRITLPLKDYIVKYIRNDGHNCEEYFRVKAETHEHALEQFENAYPTGDMGLVQSGRIVWDGEEFY